MAGENETKFVVGVQSNVSQFTRDVENAIAQVRKLEQMANGVKLNGAISGGPRSSSPAPSSDLIPLKNRLKELELLKKELEKQAFTKGNALGKFDGIQIAKSNVEAISKLRSEYDKLERALESVSRRMDTLNSKMSGGFKGPVAASVGGSTVSAARNVSIFSHKIKELENSAAEQKATIKSARAFSQDPETAAFILKAEADLNKTNGLIKKLEIASAKQRQLLLQAGAERNKVDQTIQDMRSRKQITSASSGRKSSGVDDFDRIVSEAAVSGNRVGTRIGKTSREAQILAALEASGKDPASLTKAEIARIAFPEKAGLPFNRLGKGEKLGVRNVFSGFSGQAEESPMGFARSLASQAPTASALDSGLTSYLSAIALNTQKAAAILQAIASRGVSIAGEGSKTDIDPTTGQVKMRKVTATPIADATAISPKRAAEVELRKAAELELLGAKEKIQINKEERSKLRKIEEAVSREQGGFSRVSAFDRLRSNSINANGGRFLPENFQGIMQGTETQAMFGPRAIGAANREMFQSMGTDRIASEKLRAGKEPVLENTFKRALLFGAVSVGIYKAVEAANTFLDTMIKMDKQLADLRKTLGGTDEDFSKLMESATNIARVYKGSTQDVLDAMELFSSQFKSGPDLEKLAKSAILFANLSGQSLKASAETITSTMQQYEMSVSSSAHITDAWAAVAANSAATIKDMGDAIGAAGGAAKNAGVDFDSFNAMVATISTSTGKSGKEIGNALKRIFERSTSDENVKELNKLGINVNKANGEYRDFTDVIGELNSGLSTNGKKWSELTATQQKQIAVAFAGARQYDSFIALMTHYNDVVRLTETSTNSLNAAQRQNERIGDTFVKKTQALSVEYDKLARTAGDTLLPVLGSLVDMMTKLLKLFNESPSSVRSFGMALGAIAGAGAGASFLSKALFTERSPTGQLVSRGVAGGIGDKVTGFGRGAGAFGGTDSFSLTGGLGRSVLGGLGISAGPMATFLAGLATAAAAIVALALIVATVTDAMDAFADHTKDASKAEEDTFRKGQQRAGELSKLSDRLKDVLENRKGLDGKELAKFDKSTLSPLLQDIGTNNPQILKNLGIIFDLKGNVVNQTTDRLNKLTGALDTASAAALNNAVANSQGSVRQSSSFLARNFGIAEEAFTPERAIGIKLEELQRLKQTGIDNGVIPEGVGRLGTGPMIRQFMSAIKSGTIDSANIDFDKARGLNKAFEGLPNDVISKLVDVAGDLNRTQEANQNTLQPIIAERAQDVLSAKPGAERKKAISMFKESISLFNKGIVANARGAGLDEGLAQTQTITGELPETGGFGVGVAAGGGNRRIKPQNLDITRIDFELQKSLVSNTRNFNEFGGQIRFVDNAIQSYKSALTDLNNETQKAAGPQEEMAMLAIQGQIANHQENIANIQKEKINPDLKEQKILHEQLVIASLQEKQAIQQTNEEREKGKEIIRKQIADLEYIQTLQESLRGPLNTAIGSLLSAQGTRNEALGDQNILGQRGRGTLEAKKAFAEMQMQRAIQVQALNGTSNTAAGRNELKHIREDIAGIDKEMADVLEKTNVWNQLLKNIGDTFLTKITGKFVDSAIENFGFMASGSGGSGSLLGQMNPQVNALNTNTVAIQSLTATLIAANVGSSGSHLAETLGLSEAGKGALGTAGLFGTGTLLAAGISKKSGQALDQDELDALAINAGALGTSPTKESASAGKFDKFSGNIAKGLGAALVGAGVGSAFTQGQKRTGNGGAIGGAIGGALGAGAAAMFPVVGAIASPLLTLAGGFLGSLFDKPIEAKVPELDELDDGLNSLTYELMKLDKSLNTVNDTMENLINAPSNFVLPIPKGILDNSITSQSAIATPLQAGGLIRRGGLAMLHPNETVTRAGGNGGGMGDISISFQIDGGNNNPKEIADQVMSQLNSELFKQNQRSSNYAPRF